MDIFFMVSISLAILAALLCIHFQSRRMDVLKELLDINYNMTALLLEAVVELQKNMAVAGDTRSQGGSESPFPHTRSMDDTEL